MTSSVLAAMLLMAGISHVVSQTNIVEVYFVVEPQVVRNYINYGYNAATAQSTIQSDIDYLLYQVNQFFGSMNDYGLSVGVRAKKVEFLTTEMFEECVLIGNTDLQSDMALAIFKEWLSNSNAYSNVGYDMAIVWTGYDMFGSFGENQVAGYATLGATCNENSGIAAVEFDGTMSTAITTAHEIAHSLGANHDSYNPQSQCSSHYGYIMASTSRVDNDNRWSFSYCSATDINNYIGGLSDNCLTTTTAPASSFTLADAADADILDVEKICQRKRSDANSYFCLYSDFYSQLKGDDVCQKLMCGEKGTSSCVSAMPSDGMICDNNKRCNKGKCETTSIPTGAIDTDCVFEDLQSDYINGVTGQTCTAYVGDEDYKCYNTWVHDEQCCHTCGQKERDIPDCAYGDKSSDCARFTAGQVCGSYSHICCEKCHNYSGKRSVSTNSSVVISDKSKDPFKHPHATDVTKDKNDGPPSTS